MELTKGQEAVIREVLHNYLSEDLADTIMLDISFEIEDA